MIENSRRPLWSLAAPGLAALLGAFLLTSLVGPTFTAVRRDLHGDSGLVLWSLVAFVLPALLTAAAGVVLGRRWPAATLLPGVALMVLGLLPMAFAPSVAVCCWSAGC
ncbi:hypothetical protein [Fodinicola feengrottensis]|uniref:hypothetical protein n=1 Tax=Fodinicola feengrottensis TaxID=435914 RepID=UPI0013D5D361|nr:hypothetical protein [Fodinicola feengrottensis]